MVRLLCEKLAVDRCSWWLENRGLRYTLAPFVVRIRAMQGVMVHHGGYITQHSTRIQCVVVSEMIL